MEHAVILRDRSAALSAEATEFQCAQCERIHKSLGPELPPGWEKVERSGRTEILCDECIPAEVVDEQADDDRTLVPIEGTADTPLVVDSAGWAIAPNPVGGRDISYFLYRGCRLGHWPSPESQGAAFYLVGGTAPGSRHVDDAVLFHLNRGGLRDLIEHLQAVEASITPTPAAQHG